MVEQIVPKHYFLLKMHNEKNAFEVLLFLYRQLGGCPLSGKSSMCMMCLKYRIILLIVIKNPWVQFTHIFLLRGAAPYPAGALTAPLRPPAGLFATFGGFDIPTALYLPFRHLAINLPKSGCDI